MCGDGRQTRSFAFIDDCIEDTLRIMAGGSEGSLNLGRNSDNSMIRERLGWEPGVSLRVGLEQTYRWIYDQVAALHRVGAPIGGGR